MPFTWVKIRASTTAFLTPLFWHLNRQVLVLFLYHSGNIPNLHLMDSYLDEAGNGASSPTLMTALGGPKAQSAWAKRRTGPCFVVLKPSRVCSQKLDEKWHCAIAPVKNAIMLVKKKCRHAKETTFQQDKPDKLALGCKPRKRIICTKSHEIQPFGGTQPPVLHSPAPHIMTSKSRSQKILATAKFLNVNQKRGRLVCTSAYVSVFFFKKIGGKTVNEKNDLFHPLLLLYFENPVHKISCFFRFERLFSSFDV